MAGIPFVNNIDLQKNELQSAKIHVLSSDPASPQEGQIYYNSTDKTLNYYTGAAWRVLGRLDQITAPTASVSLNSQRITSLATPSSGTDATTKDYVDALVQGGVDWKASVRVATAAALPTNSRTSNVLTASANGAINSPGVDGVTDLALTERVLVKNEATGANNGIYSVTAVGDASNPWTLTRAADSDTSAEVTAGMACWVNEGTANGDSGWIVSTNDAITLNTTALTFVQFTGLGQVTAGAGLTKTGNTLDVATASSTRITINTDSIDLGQPTISGDGATSGITKVTVDVYGRVTATAEIVTSTGLVARTAAGTFSARTITGTSNLITVTNGDGVSGNPTITVGSNVYQVGGTDVAVTDGGTGSSTAAGARTNLGAVGRYSATIGDGSTTAISITQGTHGLAATGINAVFVYDASTGQQVYPDITVAAASGNVTITFAVAPTTNQYRAVIIG